MVWNKGLTKETDERVKKISEKNKGKYHSEKTKKKISKAHKGKILSEETKEKLSKLHKGKILLEETKRKMSEAKKGKYVGEDASMYGKHHSKKTKQKMSNSLKGRKVWNKGKKGLKAWNKGISCSEETRKKISIQTKRAMANPKVKKKISKASLERIQNHCGPFKDTKPELKMKEILNELNIPFDHQFRLGNHLFDFHIPNTNILIEVDGDYWHGNPLKFKKLDYIQQKQKQRDIKHKKLAKTNNFILLRFWESDILRNTEKVKSKLLYRL